MRVHKVSTATDPSISPRDGATALEPRIPLGGESGLVVKGPPGAPKTPQTMISDDFGMDFPSMFYRFGDGVGNIFCIFSDTLDCIALLLTGFY